MNKIFLFMLSATSIALTACQTPVSMQSDYVPRKELPDVIARLAGEGSAVVDVMADVKRRRPIHNAQAQWLDKFFPRIVPLSGFRDQLWILQNIGAGVIISRDGMILTNAHVVAGGARVSVRLADGERVYRANVLGIDRATDIALLKIDAVDLPVVSLGRSDALRAGEWVAAVGSPAERPFAASTGVVGVRADDRDEPFIHVVRTGAIGSVVSSGPLINARGEVVGINSSVVGRDIKHRDAVVAVPIETALNVARRLRADNEARRDRARIRS